MPHRDARACLVSLLLGVVVCAAGCGSGRYTVTGRVTYPDGTPVTEGSVIGEAADGDRRVMAQGDIRADGSFTWGTLKPGDGAVPGSYKVAVLPRALGDSELAQGMKPAVAGKFTNYESSKLSIDVTPGGPNRLDIVVTRPGEKEQ